MELKSKIRTHARTASTGLRRVITANLAAQREKTEKHRAQVAEDIHRTAAYAREFKSMMRLAVRGAKNLVALHNTEEVRETLELLTEVHGPGCRFIVHDSDTNYGGGFLAWRWTNCTIYMTMGAIRIYLQQVCQAEPGKSEIDADLTFPSYYNGDYEVRTTIRHELGTLHQLYEVSDAWVVESVKAAQLYEGKEIPLGTELPPEWERMSWFAFLIACADEEKLAKLMEKAFKGLEASE